MNCEILDNLLLDLLYDEISGDEKIEAQTHLDGCEGCQQKFAAMGGVRRVFQSMPEPEMPTLSYQALLAEAETAAKKYAQGTAKKVEDENTSLWARLSAGMRLLLSPPFAVAAGVVLVLGVSLSVNTMSNSAPRMAQESAPVPTMAPAPMSTPVAVADTKIQAMPKAPEMPIAPPANAPLLEKAEKLAEADDVQDAPKSEERGVSFVQFAGKKSPAKAASPDEVQTSGDATGSFDGVGSVAVPGTASAELFTTQAIALAGEGKCSEAEKTARALSAGTASWCQGIQTSAKCYEQSKQGEQTRALYNEMKSFDACAAEAEKALAALNKSQVGGSGKGTQSTIRSDFKKKTKPDPAPKSIDKENTLDPFQKIKENVSF